MAGVLVYYKCAHSAFSDKPAAHCRQHGNHNRPALAYEAAGDVFYTRALDAGGTVFPNAPVRVSTFNPDYLSVSLCEVAGRPAIAFSANALYYTRASSTTGMTPWPAERQVTTKTGLRYSVLKVIGSYPSIAFIDYDTYTLHFVQALDSLGNQWRSSVTVDDRGNVKSSPISLIALTTSLGAVRAAISYGEGDLTFIVSQDSTGSSWGSRITIDGEGDTGYSSQITLIGGRPAIAYFSSVDGLYYVNATSQSGSLWNAPVQVASLASSYYRVHLLQTVSGRPLLAAAQDGIDTQLRLYLPTTGDTSHRSWARAGGLGFDDCDTASAIVDSDGFPLIACEDGANLWVVRPNDLDGDTWSSCAPCSARFCGNVNNDFDQNSPQTIRVDDVGFHDVGLPNRLKDAGFVISGYDIDYIVFEYDRVEDNFHMGIRCYVICGDTDGNGNPNITSAELQVLGGVDYPNFAESESFLIAFDFGGSMGEPPDGLLDYLIGYPAGEALFSDPFPCIGQSGLEYDVRCFGLYYYSGTSYSQPQFRFEWRTNDPILPHPVVDHNPFTSLTRPHLEWTIEQFSVLRSKSGFYALEDSPGRTLSFNMLAFAGSFDDDGVGEDFLPSGGVLNVEFPCLSCPTGCVTVEGVLDASVMSLPIIVTGDTTGATDDAASISGSCYGTSADGADHIYVFIPNVDGDYRVSTCNSALDTQVLVATDLCGVGGGTTEVGCGEDDCGWQSDTGSLTLTAGTLYFVAIEGWGGVGSYELRIEVSGPTVSPTPIRLPADAPTQLPTSTPTRAPISGPTVSPTPIRLPADAPTRLPTSTPTRAPSASPTQQPTEPISVIRPVVLEQDCMHPRLTTFSNPSTSYNPGDAVVFCMRVENEARHTSAQSLTATMTVPSGFASVRLESAQYLCEEPGVDWSALPRPWLYGDACALAERTFFSAVNASATSVSFELTDEVAYRGYVAVPSPFDTCFALSYDVDQFGSTSSLVRTVSRIDGTLANVGLVGGLSDGQTIDSIAYNPMSGVMFASSGHRFGVIALLLGGAFVTRGSIGSCRGYIGSELLTVVVDVVHSMAVHPYTQDVWALSRVLHNGDWHSYLYRIKGVVDGDLCERDVFGVGLDFVALTHNGMADEVAGISFDMATSPAPTLYVVRSASTTGQGEIVRSSIALRNDETSTLQVATMTVGGLTDKVLAASVAADGRLYVLRNFPELMLQVSRVNGTVLNPASNLFWSLDIGSVLTVDIECFTHPPSIDLSPAAYEVCVEVETDPARVEALVAAAEVQWHCDETAHVNRTSTSLSVLTSPPTSAPSRRPTQSPTRRPTRSPEVGVTSPPTHSPTRRPSSSPSVAPSEAPTDAPTDAPSDAPTDAPTHSPTNTPTRMPSSGPTLSPTDAPTKSPTDSPTKFPTNQPSKSPTVTPGSPSRSPVTPYPTNAPTHRPTRSPTHSPTRHPSDSPTIAPTTLSVATTTSSVISVDESVVCDEMSGDVTIDLIRLVRSTSALAVGGTLPRCGAQLSGEPTPTVFNVSVLGTGVLNANATSVGVRSGGETAASISAFTLGGGEGLRFEFERAVHLIGMTLRGGGGRSEALLSIDESTRKRAQSTVLIFSGMVEHVNNDALDASARFNVKSGVDASDEASFGVLDIVVRPLSDAELTSVLATTSTATSRTTTSVRSVATTTTTDQANKTGTANDVSSSTQPLSSQSEEFSLPMIVGIVLGVLGALVLALIVAVCACRAIRRRRKDRSIQDIIKQSGHRGGKQSVSRRRLPRSTFATHSPAAFDNVKASVGGSGDAIRMQRLPRAADAQTGPHYTIDTSGYVKLKKKDSNADNEESEAISPRRRGAKKAKKRGDAGDIYMPVPARYQTLGKVAAPGIDWSSLDGMKTLEQEIQWIPASPKKKKKKKKMVAVEADAPNLESGSAYMAVPERPQSRVDNGDYQALPARAAQYMAVPEKSDRAVPGAAVDSDEDPARIEWLSTSSSDQ